METNTVVEKAAHIMCFFSMESKVDLSYRRRTQRAMPRVALAKRMGSVRRRMATWCELPGNMNWVWGGGSAQGALLCFGDGPYL